MKTLEALDRLIVVPSNDADTPVWVTRGLLEGLLALARDADPRPITADLAATTASDLERTDDAKIDPDTPVFSHFYFPSAGDSNTAVFGVDLSVPAGRSGARFVSHPTGDRGLSERDPIRAVTLVAVPPWELDTVRAYDRQGRRPLELVEGEPPAETAPW
ncbi:MAG: hypothetical protein R3324_12355 [Halobacteriales archaeon]|nr:hypothetical protein [Halobacteriales archaeon]